MIPSGRLRRRRQNDDKMCLKETGRGVWNGFRWFEI